MPWSEANTETVLLIKELAEIKASEAYEDEYLNVNLRKSSYFIDSQRSFQKIDGFLSDVGGLFGFVLTFIFFMKFYTEASFEIEMGDRLFFYDSEKPLKSSSFNFLTYGLYCFYMFLKLLGVDLGWARMDMFYECREEVVEQLDVTLLLNKIVFLEKFMNVLLEEHQYRAVYLQQKPSVEEAQKLRLSHGLNKIIHRKSTQIHSKIQQKVSKHNKKILREILKEFAPPKPSIERDPNAPEGSVHRNENPDEPK